MCFQRGPCCQDFPRERQQKHEAGMPITIMSSKDRCRQRPGTHTADHSRPHHHTHPGCPNTNPISPLPITKKTPKPQKGCASHSTSAISPLSHLNRCLPWRSSKHKLFLSSAASRPSCQPCGEPPKLQLQGQPCGGKADTSSSRPACRLHLPVGAVS